MGHSTFLGATHLLDLTLLAPDIQEQILFAESVDRASSHIDRREDPVGGVAQAGCGSEEGRYGNQ
jgi:hypothetical protein